MPRQARIDGAGALHHIICRGIERKEIFSDNLDRDDFVSRLENVLVQTSTRCYAWALIPNHFHLLLQTGNVPVATVMRKLLSGYATKFNRRHGRHGHLSQNRYKSILCAFAGETYKFMGVPLWCLRGLGIKPEEFADIPVSDLASLPLPDLVRVRREQKDLSIEELAERIGYFPVVVEALENGRADSEVCIDALRSVGTELDIPFRLLLEKI